MFINEFLFTLKLIIILYPMNDIDHVFETIQDIVKTDAIVDESV